MFESTVTYSGLVTALVGLVMVIKPITQLGITTRPEAAIICGIGIVVAAIGLNLPTSESRSVSVRAKLDEFVPTWQFNERHSIEIDAPPARVIDAVRGVRADEIFLFRTLTWIRRGGRAVPQSILNAGGDGEPIIDVALKGGFVMLADDAAHEIVLGTVVITPRGSARQTTAATFKSPPPGCAVAAMNFVVTPAAPEKTILMTETRVYANGARERRKFARYWRMIYPGSAIIRRMWLRAARRRAMTPAAR